MNLIHQQSLAVWRAYPRKVGKATALKKIVIAIREIGYDELLAKVQAYGTRAGMLLDDDKQFIPHGSTYFNQRKWDDEDDGLESMIQKAKTKKHTHYGIGAADELDNRRQVRMAETIRDLRASFFYGKACVGLTDREVWERHVRGELTGADRRLSKWTES